MQVELSLSMDISSKVCDTDGREWLEVAGDTQICSRLADGGRSISIGSDGMESSGRPSSEHKA